jgi:hypothetical protein
MLSVIKLSIVVPLCGNKLECLTLAKITSVKGKAESLSNFGLLLDIPFTIGNNIL